MIKFKLAHWERLSCWWAITSSKKSKKRISKDLQAQPLTVFNFSKRVFFHFHFSLWVRSSMIASTCLTAALAWSRQKSLAWLAILSCLFLLRQSEFHLWNRNSAALLGGSDLNCLSHKHPAPTIVTPISGSDDRARFSRTFGGVMWSFFLRVLARFLSKVELKRARKMGRAGRARARA